MRGSKAAAALAPLLLTVSAQAQKFYSYVGDIGPDFVLLAWGTVEGVNTIGRSSKSHGRATVRVGDHTVTVTDANWTVVRDLQPDTEYAYRIALGERSVGEGRIKTWPRQSERLCFFVIGDWGNGSTLQYQVAGAMRKDFERRRGSPCPVRFVLSTGDNIYGLQLLAFGTRRSGRYDSDWGPKFFQPYESIIASIPFYPVLGNHDGNESEHRGDLAAYLDNFFFSGFSPARYYRFSYGGFVDFFALDSTLNSEEGSVFRAYSETGDQHKWLIKNLAESEVQWKIPYFHHPVFSAGPRHAPSNRDLAHFLKEFRDRGVKVVFTGHEHNFQFSEKSAATFDIRFITTGAGGELRSGSVRPAMERSRIDGWSPSAHFLHVEIEGREMRITPLSFEELTVYDRRGRPMDLPVKVELR